MQPANIGLRSPTPQRINIPVVEHTDPHWNGLYITGAVAALITAALTITGVVSFIAWPPPSEATVTEWFALFQDNWLRGMLSLDLLMLLAYIALIPVVLALYIALRHRSESLMTLAATLGLVAIATYFASSRLFEMLALSQQYAAATTDAERSTLVAAGQSMLTSYLGAFAPPMPIAGGNYQGTAFNLSFALWCVAAMIISVVMLRSASFGKITGVVGIVGNVAALGLFLPVIGIVLSLVSLPILLVWYVLIARGLFRLSGSPETLASVPETHG